MMPSALNSQLQSPDRPERFGAEFVPTPQPQQFQNETVVGAEQFTVQNYSDHQHLHVQAETRQASELATPAGDTFVVPVNPEVTNNEAYVSTITAEQSAVSPENQRHASDAEAIAEITNSGPSVMAIRNLYALAA
jgi:hypothetical protein